MATKVIKLSARDAKAFLEALDRPPAPNPKLRALLRSKPPWALRVIITKDKSGWFVAECLDLPGCVSQGRTKRSAMANIREAIRLSLETRKELGL